MQTMKTWACTVTSNEFADEVYEIEGKSEVKARYKLYKLVQTKHADKMKGRKDFHYSVDMVQKP